MKRTPLGNKIRFDVFKRDLFTCQYCGNTPPHVILEVDHIIPVSKGGDNLFDNLITSCFQCNRGKGANELTSLPSTTSEKLEIIQEKEDQYKAYQKMLSAIERRIKREIEKVDERFSSFFPKKSLSDSFKDSSVRKFIKELGLNEVIDAMTIACSRMNSEEEAVKYFCGICWGRIKNR